MPAIRPRRLSGLIVLEKAGQLVQFQGRRREDGSKRVKTSSPKLYKDTDDNWACHDEKSYVESNGTVLTTNWAKAKRSSKRARRKAWLQKNCSGNDSARQQRSRSLSATGQLSARQELAFLLLLSRALAVRRATAPARDMLTALREP